jgi:DNA mismatch endonuclease (patch repair protein)
MRAIPSCCTKGDRAVRAALVRLGVTFDCNVHMTGTSDVKLLGKRVLFVHGCWWYAHDCPTGRRKSLTNTAYWTLKQAQKVAQNVATASALARDGWRLLDIYECETRNFKALQERLRAFLDA